MKENVLYILKQALIGLVLCYFMTVFILSGQVYPFVFMQMIALVAAYLSAYYINKEITWKGQGIISLVLGLSLIIFTRSYFYAGLGVLYSLVAGGLVQTMKVYDRKDSGFPVINRLRSFLALVWMGEFQVYILWGQGREWLYRFTILFPLVVYLLGKIIGCFIKDKERDAKEVSDSTRRESLKQDPSETVNERYQSPLIMIPLLIGLSLLALILVTTSGFIQVDKGMQNLGYLILILFYLELGRYYLNPIKSSLIDDILSALQMSFLVGLLTQSVVMAILTLPYSLAFRGLARLRILPSRKDNSEMSKPLNENSRGQGKVKDSKPFIIVFLLLIGMMIIPDIFFDDFVIWSKGLQVIAPFIFYGVVYLIRYLSQNKSSS